MLLGKNDHFSTHQAMIFAWSTFKKSRFIFVGIIFTFFISWVILEMIVIAGQSFGILVWFLAHLAFFLFFAGLQVGMGKICLALYDGKTVSFQDTFQYLELGPKFFVGQVLFLVMVVVGLVLGIFPGIYWGVRYGFFGFFLFEPGASLADSFRRSAALSNGSQKSLFFLSIIHIVLNLIGASLLGLGLFLTIPLTMLMMTSVYRQLEETL